MRGLSGLSTTLIAFLLLVRGSVEPQAQPITSEQWEGFYLGTHVGAVESSTGILDLDRQIFDDDGGTLFTNDLNVTGGVHAGYNVQSGNRVFGIEADYSWTDAGRSRLFEGGDHFLSSDIDGFGSIRGRAGLAVDNALIYFTGGVGLIDLNLSGTNDPSTPGSTDVSFDEQIAAVVGAGAEAKLGSNLSARLEYLHYFGGNEIDLCQVCNPDDPAHASAALQVVRVGITYHIGDSPEPGDTTLDDPWSGFYLGVHAGAADTSTGLHDESKDISNTLEGTLFTGDLSAAGGVHAGYNHVIRSLLLGIEVDYSWTDAGDARIYNDGNNFASSKIDGFGSVRGRLGVASGNAAAYITGGVGFVDVSVAGVDFFDNDASSIKDQFALVAGAGTEAKISSSLSTRLEYLYYGFDEKSDTCAACGSDVVLADGSIHYVRVGLTYHLNGTPADEHESEAGNWAGFYAGAHAGVAHSNTRMHSDNLAVFGSAGLTAFTPSTDPAGGVHAGYNFQYGNAVFGLEGDYTFVNAKKGSIFGRNFYQKDSEIHGFGSVRGRLGLAAGDALFYTTGGIGFIDATLSGGRSDIPARFVKFNNDFTALVAGGGVALKLTDNIAFRTEYLYYGFDEKSETCVQCNNEPAFASGVIHTARAGLTFLFN